MDVNLLATFFLLIGLELVLGIVFSIDSVITAVGLTDSLPVIYGAVVLSFVGVLAFAGHIANFVQRHPTLKILALVVELLQLRFAYNAERRKARLQQ